MSPGFEALLAASTDDRRDAFIATGRRLGTAEQNVEKDFWVCSTLDALVASERRDEVESASSSGYLRLVDMIDEARAFAIARQLIAEHGDDVARILQARIDAAMAAGDLEQCSAWFIIRNAVTLSLKGGSTAH